MIREYPKTTVRSRKIIRSILIPLICILVLLLLLKVGIGLRGQSILPVRTVQIFGNDFVSDREIIGLLKMNRDTSMLFLNLDRAKELLLNDKRIERTEMVKVYPDTLRIHVWEKEKAAVLISGEKRYWASVDGVVLMVADRQSYSDYPIITLLSKDDDIKIGNPLDDFMVTNLLNAAKQFRQSNPDFSARIQSYTVDDIGIWVYLKDMNYRIYLGGTVSLNKLQRLRALIIVLKSVHGGENSQSGMIEIDMSFSHAAVIEGDIDYEL